MALLKEIKCAHACAGSRDFRYHGSRSIEDRVTAAAARLMNRHNRVGDRIGITQLESRMIKDRAGKEAVRFNSIEGAPRDLYGHRSGSSVHCGRPFSLHRGPRQLFAPREEF